jgi:predicted nuclease of predicted toxin-antitoxin system
VKFLIDAQLPRRLAVWLQQRGHDVIHTLDLAEQNRTPDSFLLALANKDHCVLITKDTDFEITHELGQGPPKLLLVTTGNIHNDELLALFARHEETVVRLLDQHTFIELSRSQLIVHK